MRGATWNTTQGEIMSDQTGDVPNSAQAADPLKDERRERDQHLPTMPDPTRDPDADVRLPGDKNPSKKPSLIDEPEPMGDEDDTKGLEQIA
jgi:hypothetical protein